MQTLGVIAATVLVARFLPTAIGSNRYMSACLVVTAAVSSILFFNEVDRGVRQMKEERNTIGGTAQAYCSGAPCRPYRDLSATEATDQVGTRMGVNAGFVEWVRSRLRGDSYYLAMTAAPEAGAFPQWITYRLLPSLATGIEGQLGNGKVRSGSLTLAKESDWIVFYGVDPRKWPTGGRAFRDYPVKTFGPGFALMKVSS